MNALYAIANLKTPLEADEAALRELVAQRLGLAPERILDLRVVRESIDARKSPRLFLVRKAEFRLATPLRSLPPDVAALERSSLDIPAPAALAARVRPAVEDEPIVVIGAGPAGLFAALALGEAGARTVLLERGKPVETRMRDIGQLRSHGALDPESNVCFGEGGAGAYTDGKLYTRIKHPYVRYVMRRLVDFQAPERILVDAHPHLGTDKLVRIVKRIRERIVECGVDVRFQARVERVLIEQGRVRGVRLADGSEILASRVVLAIGHSARDTLQRLHEDGLALEAKPFAVGVRVEHPQELINRRQYGVAKPHKALGAAAYALTYQHPDADMGRRGVYSFCMCPGGFIVPSPTEAARMAVNGMSNANRSTPYANSGVVAQVAPEDLRRRGFPDTPLIGIAFQRELEARAFQAVGRAYDAPASRISDFLARRLSADLPDTNYRPGVEAVDLWSILPDWIAEPLAAGLRHFSRKLPGFDSETGAMLAVESRTSSPIRVTRGEDLMSVNVRGLYPVGEGAGYAGGIVSAAVDGLKAAEAILKEPR